jgi:hypothetical protein
LVCIREDRCIVVKTVLGPKEIGTDYDEDLIEAFTRVTCDTLKGETKGVVNTGMTKGEIRRIIEDIVERSIDERLDRFLKHRGLA